MSLIISLILSSWNALFPQQTGKEGYDNCVFLLPCLVSLQGPHRHPVLSPLVFLVHWADSPHNSDTAPTAWRPVFCCTGILTLDTII